MTEEEKEVPKKKKPKIPRQPMPEQDPHERAKNFKEVTYGFTAEFALNESIRCIQCKKPVCIDGCPVNINIPEFMLTGQPSMLTGLSFFPTTHTISHWSS